MLFNWTREADVDLAQLIPTDAVPIGYVATLKYLDRDGTICSQTFVSGMSGWEAIQLNVQAMEDLQADIQR